MRYRIRAYDVIADRHHMRAAERELEVIRRVPTSRVGGIHRLW
jgi:hypothetical protein